MGRKEISVAPSDAGTHVRVNHSLLGAWEFTLALPLSVVAHGMSEMSRGALIQDALPGVDAATREQFITPPEMYAFCEEDDDGAA